MKLPLAIIANIILAPLAFADGTLFVNGKVPNVAASEFELTAEQIHEISFFAKCHKNNTKSPYLFKLTTSQALALKQVVGFVPSRFAVFDSFRGDKGEDLGVNIVVRYDYNHIQVPHNLLFTEVKAVEWEKNIIGWQVNPLAAAKKGDIESGKCPY